jgi:RNA polymerase sigma factor (sigma-70 family)
VLVPLAGRRPLEYECVWTAPPVAPLDVEGLYRTYAPLVLRRARAILGEEQAAKDAVQEIFMRVLHSWDDFRGDASPTTWLYRVTTNHCLNLIRDRDRRATLLAERVPPAAEVSAHEQENRLTVAQLLKQMPEQLREIAVYHFVDQLSRDEIAVLLAISPRTVHNRLVAFRELARSAMAEGKRVAR